MIGQDIRGEETACKTYWLISSCHFPFFSSEVQLGWSQARHRRCHRLLPLRRLSGLCQSLPYLCHFLLPFILASKPSPLR
jgi:hypothetical protein